MRKTKRLVAAFMSAIMAFSATAGGVNVFAAETTEIETQADGGKVTAMGSHKDTDTVYPVEGGNIYLDMNTYNNQSFRVIDCDEGVTKAVIPESINGIKIITIEEGAFKDLSLLKSVYISDNVKYIRSGAFENCLALEDVRLPVLTDSTSNYTGFINCPSLTDVTVPDGTTYFSGNLFKDCTSLKSIDLPDSITRLNMGFDNCPELENVNINNDKYISKDGFVYSKSSTYAQLVFCSRKKIRVVIPNEIDGLPVTAFSGFNGCNLLEEVTIPEGVTRIRSLTGCPSLKIINLHDKIKEIDDNAFKNSNAIEKINIDNEYYKFEDGILYELVGRGVHYDTGYGDFSIDGYSNGIKYVCKYKSGKIKVEDGVDAIAGNAFQDMDKLTEVELPDSVFRIDDCAFANCTTLKKINLGNSVSIIESNAFGGCKSLEEIKLPDSLNYLFSGAFQGCENLKEVVFGTGLKWIGYEAFKGCISLESLHLPEGLESIGVDAFCDCTALKEIYFPTTISSMPGESNNSGWNGDSAFANCDNLETVTINQYIADNFGLIMRKSYYSPKNLKKVIFNKDVILLDNIINAKDYLPNYYYYEFLGSNENYVAIDGALYSKDKKVLISFPRTTTGSFKVPSQVDVIGEDAFSHTALTSVDVSNVSTISDAAFFESESLKNVNLNVVSSIGESAFSRCTGLEDIILPDTLTEVKPKVFRECSALKNVILPKSLTYIGESMFSGCTSLEDITIPNNVKALKECAFRKAGLKKLIIPESVETIETWACADLNNLETLVIPKSITEFGEEPFNNTGSMLTTLVTGQKGLEGDWRGWNIKHLEFLDDVKMINSQKFGEYIEYIDIPVSVESIDGNRFSQLNKLKELRTGKVGFNAVNFKSAEKIYLYDDITEIPDEKFSGKYINSIHLPETLEKIGDKAFYNCLALEEIKIPDNVSEIGELSFYECRNLKSLDLPSKITSIKYRTFYCCHSLESITIPDNVTYIGKDAFAICGNLKSIDIPNGVTQIDESAFFNCEKLTSIVIPDSITAIGEGVFNYCRSLKSVVMPATVLSIANTAFLNIKKENLTFYVEKDSYAEIWAKNAGYKTGNDIPDGFTAALKTDSIYLKEYNFGETFSLSVYTKKADSQNPLEVTWTTSNDSIASVEPKSGKTTADRYYYGAEISTHSVEGDVTITAALPNGSNVQFPFKVAKSTVEPERVLINGKEKYDTSNPSDHVNITLVFNEPVSLNKNLAEESSRFSLYKDKPENTGSTSGKVAHIISDDVYQMDAYTIVIKYPNTDFMPYLYADFKDEVLTAANQESAKLELDKVFPITLSSYDSEKLYQMKISKTTNMQEAAAQYEKALDAFNEAARKALINQYPDAAGKYESMIDTLDSMLTGEERLDAEAREACRRALYGVLGNIADTKYSFKFDNDPTKMGVEMVNTVLHSMDSKKYTFNEIGSGYKATADVFATGGVMTGSVYYEKKNTSNGADAGMIAVSSSKGECEKAFKEYFEELTHLEITSVMAGVKSLITYYTDTAGLGKFNSITLFANNPSMHEKALSEAGLGGLLQSYEEGKKIAGDLSAILNGEDGEESYKALEHLVSIKNDKFFDEPKISGGHTAYLNLKKAREALIDCVQYTLEHKEMPKPKSLAEKALEWIGINCPVNLYVYDESGTEIGSAVNGEVTVNSDKIEIETDGDSIKLYLLTEDKISFKLVAYDYGMLNITREKLQDGVGVGREVFYDIPLNLNDELTSNEISVDTEKLTINTPNGTKESDIILDTADNGVVKINCNAYNGTVLGDGEYIKGDKVRLVAIPDEGCYFAGWYFGGKLLASADGYEFIASEDMNITADIRESSKDDSEFVFGDADGDGTVTASDAALVLQKTLTESVELPIKKNTEDWFKYVDVDGDTYITASDAALILQKTLSEKTIFPAEN